MAKPTEEMFDKRVVDRNIEKGLISKADHQKYLSKLSDREGDAEWVDMDASEEETASDEEAAPAEE